MAVVSIRKSYPGHAKRVMFGIWSFLRQFMYTKFIVVTDEDIDVRNWKDVVWAITTRMDPVRDTVLVENTPIDYLDFASPVSGLGGKMGLDATSKWPGELIGSGAGRFAWTLPWRRGRRPCSMSCSAIAPVGRPEPCGSRPLRSPTDRPAAPEPRGPREGAQAEPSPGCEVQRSQECRKFGAGELWMSRRRCPNAPQPSSPPALRPIPEVLAEARNPAVSSRRPAPASGVRARCRQRFLGRAAAPASSEEDSAGEPVPPRCCRPSDMPISTPLTSAV